MTPINLSGLPCYTFTHGEFIGGLDAIIPNTDYTGADGSELYFHPGIVMRTWNVVFKVGAEFGIKLTGSGARGMLRPEMGSCLYGNDLDNTTSSIKAELGWTAKSVEDKNFINRPMLEKRKAEDTTRELVGFGMVDRSIPRHDYEL